MRENRQLLVLTAFFLILSLIVSYPFVFADEKLENDSVDSSRDGNIRIEDVDSGKSSSENFGENLFNKTKDVVSQVVSGQITATEHAQKLDLTLSDTFFRIQDCWTLCRQEIILAREESVHKVMELKHAAVERLLNQGSEKLLNDISEKIQDTVEYVNVP